MSTSNNMLKILTLFTIEQPVLDADIICEKLEFSKPTGYRYIKDLIVHGLLERLHGGQYTLGPRISVMDYIAQRSSPILHVSTPVMKEIVDQTDFSCCLTQFYEDYCLDIHHESHQASTLLPYGRGRPRPAYAGAAPKVILAHTAIKTQKSIFDKYSAHFIETKFAENESTFIKRVNQVKKDGYYFSRGELESHLGAIAVPIIPSSKAFPLSLSIVGSVKRLNLIQAETIVDILNKAVKQIESEFNHKMTIY